MQIGEKIEGVEKADDQGAQAQETQESSVPASLSDKKKYINNVFDLLIQTQQGYRELLDLKPREHVQRVKINTDKPIAVVFASDIHLGSIFTDYKQLKEMWEWVLETPNLYLAINGDFIDNFAAPVPKLLMAGIDSQIIPPSAQRLLYKTYLHALQEQGKILSMVIGNHEDMAGLDIWFEKDLKFPISSNRMYLWITVGRQEYRIGMVHKSRFNSILNPVHSCIRELHLYYPDADIICTSHTHMPAFMQMPYPRDGQMFDRFLIKTGTMKDRDLFTYKYFNPYQVGDLDNALQAVIFYPDRRAMRYCSFFDAISVLI